MVSGFRIGGSIGFRVLGLGGLGFSCIRGFQGSRVGGLGGAFQV